MIETSESDCIHLFSTVYLSARLFEKKKWYSKYKSQHLLDWILMMNRKVEIHWNNAWLFPVYVGGRHCANGFGYISNVVLHYWFMYFSVKKKHIYQHITLLAKLIYSTKPILQVGSINVWQGCLINASTFIDLGSSRRAVIMQTATA